VAEATLELDDGVSSERRYYISSFAPNAIRAAEAARGYWWGLRTRRIGFSMWRLVKLTREFESAMRSRIWRRSENLRITCCDRKRR